jgi:hypothetical protein
MPTDYVFPEYDVIAELKRLEKDRNQDHELYGKIQQLYQELLVQGKRVPLIYGTVQIKVRNLLLECAHQIISLFKKPIQRRIRDANEQIRSAKKALDMGGARGLLIFVQDGDYSINPETVINLAQRCFQGPHFTCINDLVFTNGNMRAIRPGDPLDYKFFVYGYRDARRAVPPELIERLDARWRQELDRIAGFALPAIKSANFAEFIDSLRYAKPTGL